MSQNRRRSRLNSIAKPLLTKLLCSRLHGLVSRSTMLITVVGRKSGTTYTTPVNYICDRDGLIVLSCADRTWWRNLRGGALVILRLAGRDVEGFAQVIEHPEAVADAVHTMVSQLPDFRKRFRIKLIKDQLPARPEKIARLIQGRVVIRITGLNDTDVSSERHSGVAAR